MQLASYKKDSNYRHLRVNNELINKESSPITYWLGKCTTWPQLAKLALDIYAIPVMSDEPERVYSTTGPAVHPRRRALQDTSINNLITVKAWS